MPTAGERFRLEQRQAWAGSVVRSRPNRQDSDYDEAEPVLITE